MSYDNTKPISGDNFPCASDLRKSHEENIFNEAIQKIAKEIEENFSYGCTGLNYEFTQEQFAIHEEIFAFLTAKGYRIQEDSSSKYTFCISWE